MAGKAHYGLEDIGKTSRDAKGGLKMGNWEYGNGPIGPEGRLKSQDLINEIKTLPITQQIQHVQGPNPDPYGLKVERGQKGGYAWEISMKGADILTIIDQIKCIDAELRKRFLEG